MSHLKPFKPFFFIIIATVTLQGGAVQDYIKFGSSINDLENEGSTSKGATISYVIDYISPFSPYLGASVEYGYSSASNEVINHVIADMRAGVTFWKASLYITGSAAAVDAKQIAGSGVGAGAGFRATVSPRVSIVLEHRDFAIKEDKDSTGYKSTNLGIMYRF